MSIHQLPVRGRTVRGSIYVWSDAPGGFQVSHQSASGGSWGDVTVYGSGEAAITAAFVMNRDVHDGCCTILVCAAAMADADRTASISYNLWDF